MTRIDCSQSSSYSAVVPTYQDPRPGNPLDDLYMQLLKPRLGQPPLIVAQHKIGSPTGVMTTGVMTPTGMFLTVLHALPLNLDRTQKPEKIKQYLQNRGIKMISPLFSLNTHETGGPIYDAVIGVPLTLLKKLFGSSDLSPVPGGVQVGQPQAPKPDMSKQDFLKLVFLGGNGRSRPEDAPVFTGQSGSVLVNSNNSPVFMLIGKTETRLSNAVSSLRNLGHAIPITRWLPLLGEQVSRFARKKNIAFYVPLVLRQGEPMYLIAHDRGTSTLHRMEFNGIVKQLE